MTRAGKKRPAIGKSAGGSSSPKAMNPYSGASINRGYRASQGRYTAPAVVGKGFNGSQITTFPYYDPVLGGRTKVFQLTFPNFHISTCVDEATPGDSGFIEEGQTQTATVAYRLMLDNLARAYANAQNLELSSITDLFTFIDLFARAYGCLLSVASILNADGFNEQTSRLARSWSNLRSAVQANFDRLATIPMAQGIVDIVTNTNGYFAPADGADCLLIEPFGYQVGTYQPYDLSSATAAATSIMPLIGTLVLNLVTAAEAGPIRIILSEWFGNPPKLATPGVRIHRGLYDSFRLMATLDDDGTNVFGFPALSIGVPAVIDAGIPLLVPRGLEDYSLMYTWWARPNMFALFDEVTSAHRGLVGLQTSGVGTTPGSTTGNAYATGDTGAPDFFDLADPLDGFGSPWSDFYWAPMTAANAANYNADRRMQEDFTVFSTNPSFINSQTGNVLMDVLAGKISLPLPSGVTEYSCQRLFR